MEEQNEIDVEKIKQRKMCKENQNICFLSNKINKLKKPQKHKNNVFNKEKEIGNFN